LALGGQLPKRWETREKHGKGKQGRGKKKKRYGGGGPYRKGQGVAGKTKNHQKNHAVAKSRGT